LVDAKPATTYDEFIEGFGDDIENEITYTLQEAIDLVGDYPTQCQDCETGVPCHAKRIGRAPVWLVPH
jgi:hypothetical protein